MPGSDMPSEKQSTIRELPFKPPFDWERLLRFFGGRSTAGVEAVENGVYLRAIEWHGDIGTLAVSRHPQDNVLVAVLEGKVSRHADELVAPLSRMFGLDADPKPIRRHLAADPWLAPLLKAAPGLRLPGAWSAFELIVRTIVGQQVSVKAATTIVGRLVERAGERIERHPHEATSWRFPTPHALAAADLTAIGMPGKRVAALQGFAHAVAIGDVPVDAPDVDLADRRKALLALPGIGPWTVEYVAMRAWRDADAWPASDLVLMQAIAGRDPALLKLAHQRARAEAWRPWRAYVAMHLWNEIADRSGSARGG
ncbi:3-methyladenine DNA glycosylase/8-oxoguanine DNA glycosylase [Herbaspirillum sp. CF444]|nr:3-methyladenine DNA glycosylase/8-oxoguanine DNA glycosylase [Herbaspirillum sp. CF444]